MDLAPIFPEETFACRWLYKEVPFGEIEANSSDPKHVGWPMEPSGGLGVLGLTGSALGVVEPL